MIEVNNDILELIDKNEDADISVIKEGIAAGTIVVPANNKHKLEKPCAIGKDLTTKVNANIGLSEDHSDIDGEMRKLDAAVEAGADALMDLSTGPKLGELRRKILSSCPIPLGTVPVYELLSGTKEKFFSMGEEDFLDVIKKQAEEGVDFFTIHSGLTLEITRSISPDTRTINIVSRGGALLASWMLSNNRENPFYSRFDDILAIAKEYDIVLSLGDSLRPGAISDATDRLQIQELLVLGDLQQRAMAADVQVMIEGPGHVPIDQIEANVKLQKSICHGSPFYVLGPLVTDAAPGYDHIVSAIGGAIAASHGADFLCYVTPAEHLCLPDVDDVRMGVIASKIAAHAADIVKKIPSAIERDLEMSKARAARDWKRQFELAIDPKTPSKVRDNSLPKEEDICSMCSDLCSIKVFEDCMEQGKGASVKD